GSLNRFFPVVTSVDNQRQESEPGQDDDHNSNDDPEVNEHSLDDNIDADVNEDNTGEENSQPSPDARNGDEQDDSLLSIYDPRTWDNLDNRKRDILIEKGPVRELGLEFPARPDDVEGRRFSYAYYSRKLANKEVMDRKWLVYSKELDKVFCFACKLFKSNQSRSLLASDGLRDWKHLSGDSKNMRAVLSI
uniref:TTF-type domain-containing protein n=1 Tax=Aegilops tauschii subsp. strangulata TaxID=200361 RepID=A0A453RDG6_AEGTS